MKQALLAVHMTAVQASNILVFLSCVIPRGVPINRWLHAWRHVQAAHELEITRLLTELTMAGQIKRRIVDGEFRYYPPDTKQ